jgi:hypothetical protein
MAEMCELDVPRTELLECPRCTEIFFERVSHVGLDVGHASVPIVVTRRYVLRKCYEGVAVGQLAYSLTLVPNEEVEIEIIRRSKFSRALHEQRSVESEFRFEFQNTSRDEWSSEEESNFKVTGDEGFKIFGIGVKSTQEYSSREKSAEKHLREIVTKSASRVSQKYEVAIDTKTEVENQYRSVRKIKNPNSCQPVIYLYYQLAKKYRTELELTDVRVDVPIQVPPILIRPIPAAIFAATAPYRQSLDLEVVAAPPPWTLTGATSSAEGGAVAIERRLLLASGRSVAAAIAQLPPVEAPVDEPDVLQLTAEEALAKVVRVRPDINAKAFDAALKKFLALEDNKPGVRGTYEYCIDTDGLYVEAELSKCSACDETMVELQRLEVEKARAELEKLGEGGGDD